MPLNFRPNPNRVTNTTVSDEMKLSHLNFQDDQVIPKTSEKINSFKGTSKLTKKASKASRKLFETLTIPLEKFGSWVHVPDLSCSWSKSCLFSFWNWNYDLPLNSHEQFNFLLFYISRFYQIYAPLVRMDIFILRFSRETLIKRMSLSSGWLFW